MTGGLYLKGLGTKRSPATLTALSRLSDTPSIFLSSMETIKGVEILKPGQVKDANGNDFNPSASDFQSILDAYNAGVIRRIPVKIGHTSDEYNLAIAKALKVPPMMVVGENGRGAINLGEFKNLRGKGGSIYADIEVPKPVARLAKDKLIRNLSMEILNNVGLGGKFYPMVVKAGCLLGRENPAIPLNDFKLGEYVGSLLSDGEYQGAPRIYTLSEFGLSGPTIQDVHQMAILKKKKPTRYSNKLASPLSGAIKSVIMRLLKSRHTIDNKELVRRYKSMHGSDAFKNLVRRTNRVEGGFAKPTRIDYSAAKAPESLKELIARTKSESITGPLALKRIMRAQIYKNSEQQLASPLSGVTRSTIMRLLKNKASMSVKNRPNRVDNLPTDDGIRSTMVAQGGSRGPIKGTKIEGELEKFKRILRVQGYRNSEFELANAKSLGLHPTRKKYISTTGAGKSKPKGYPWKKIEIGPLALLRKIKGDTNLAEKEVYKVPVTKITPGGSGVSKRVEVLHVKASDPSRAATSALRLLERGLGRTMEIVGAAGGVILAVHLGKKYIIGNPSKGRVPLGAFVKKLSDSQSTNSGVSILKLIHKGVANG